LFSFVSFVPFVANFQLAIAAEDSAGPGIGWLVIPA
jgi:hypothetical protein